MVQGYSLIRSKSSEYALMIMAVLVSNRGRGYLRARDIAEEIGLSPSYVSKILRKLVQSGLLVAEKGHGGGFRLVLHPERVRFLDIIESVEGSENGECCQLGWEGCGESNTCILHHRWKRLYELTLGWATKTTLGDIERDIERERQQGTEKE